MFSKRVITIHITIHYYYNLFACFHCVSFHPMVWRLHATPSSKESKIEFLLKVKSIFVLISNNEYYNQCIKRITIWYLKFDILRLICKYWINSWCVEFKFYFIPHYCRFILESSQDEEKKICEHASI